MKPETYIKRLKSGKQLRIKFDKEHKDNIGNWWKEELICYDSKLNIFKCYFRDSSYDDKYCDYYSEDSLMNKLFLEGLNLRAYEQGEVYEDCVSTIAMILEKNTIQDVSVTIMDLFVEKLSYFTENELIELLTML